ncbi:sulfite exporter TauE/SafE family protein [Noviherbaspirillum sp. CPCC 100848]|uniref:Probable membrane transporter protein n=1 Tax=Noviherbaspirillum album TaxID=3080276 RepID=A0ABU6J5P1_9BURK|nr:sulfite exporter TauE/SafE family protein [Noviherbaspirillum sp. CPCC 100848]MEC4718731.1 sulfite exporter TauE/SafE family protein [Noviherbaspirillum sp. CPCC 100848]
MDISLIAALLALGAAVGYAAGLLGIGGGMLLVPFMTMVLTARNFPEEHIVHMAIATSLATIMFTSISSVRAHHARGAVLWNVVKLLAPGILIGSWIGPWIGAQLDSEALAMSFAIFVAFSATQMLLDKKPAASRDLPKPPGMFAAGGVIGVLAGLVGAGGGFVSVPFMTWCNVKIHNAVATSAALGFPIALAGTLSNIYYGLNEPDLPSGSLGYIYLPALLVISLASVTTAPLGARTAHKLPVKSLKRVFAIILYVLAAYMLYKAFD